ncbi:MAG: arsenosugar biosynthesis radical SAM (seleno)protein ArsS [Phycisphaerae bacterium]
MTTCVPLTVNSQNAFDRDVEEAADGGLRGRSIQTVQVNIGLKCNLACQHCHVESSPKRTEEMDWPTTALVLDAARRSGAHTLDITGGAPEMHPHFRRFVQAARELGLHVMVRTNLTIMLENGYEDLPEFFREQQVHLIASLPCYLEENVDRQRGKHVYVESVEVLKRLNAVGYGTREELPLDLVYNPLGPSLPPPQTNLEQAYRRELAARFGIKFTKLITITNMPIGRFLHDLRRQGKAAHYWQLLKGRFNAETIDSLMCRHQLHVGHDGTAYDCDFNYALGRPVNPEAGMHIRDFDPDTYVRRRIATGEHCYGCTAGCGSSCGGALV